MIRIILNIRENKIKQNMMNREWKKNNQKSKKLDNKIKSKLMN